MNRTYQIDWLDCRVFVDAGSRGKAKACAMRKARDAEMWQPGTSLKGLRCRIAKYVPSDAVVYHG